MQAKETNTLLYVKDEYIRQLDSGEYTVKTDISCAQISVKRDIVSFIDGSCSGYDLIKRWSRRLDREGILVEIEKTKKKIFS